jgi:YD repeat-containing protein
LTGYTRLQHTDFQTAPAYTGTPAHVLGLPIKKLTCDSSGCSDTTYKAKALFFYDNQSLPTQCGTIAPIISPGTIAQHDDSGHGTAFIQRGNLSCEARAYHIPGNGAEQWIARGLEYDTAGNRLTYIDFNNHKRTFTYVPTCGSVSNSRAFIQTVTNALNKTTTYGYDCYLGKVTSVVDANSMKTSLVYETATNLLGRLLTVTDGISLGAPASMTRNTQFVYADTPPQTVTTMRDQNTALDAVLTSTTTYDGLGRPTQASTKESSTSSIITTTEYDALSRIWKKSNPVRGTPADSDKTRFSYDELGRATNITYPDSSVESHFFDGNQETVTEPSPSTPVTAQKEKKLVYDGLGRLNSVYEDVTVANYLTSYTYDQLNDLTGAQEGGQTRTFTYNELGRLTSAANPESGTVIYSYDGNGNLTTKTLAGGRSVTTTYDVLNRPTNRSYSSSDTLPVSYTYDTCWVGRLCSVSVTGSSPSSSTTFTYDVLSRFHSSSQQKYGLPAYNFSYGYSLSGALLAETYPFGRNVSGVVDGANRLQSVTGTRGGTTTQYAQSVLYAPHGGIASMLLGNGLTEQTCYNNRLQVTNIRLGTGIPDSICTGGSADAWQLTVGYPASPINNGNVSSQNTVLRKTDGTTQTQTQSYLYDNVDRLTSVTEGATWNQGYGYDQYGNRWVSSSSLPLNMATPVAGPQFDTATNHISKTPADVAMPAGAYDPDGELVNHPNIGQMQYDTEGRMTQFVSGGQTTSFQYDGMGHRVAKTGSTGTTIYVYDAFDHLAAEYNAQSSAPLCTTCYLTADWLGSTRVVTDGSSGATVAQHDYEPFGEELLSTAGRQSVLHYGAADGITEKFTSKERDAETGLDYFGAR